MQILHVKIKEWLNSKYSVQCVHSEPEQKSLSLRFSSSTKNLSLSPKKRPGLDLDPSQQAKTLHLELSNHPHSFLIDKILRKGVMTRIVLDNKKAELAQMKKELNDQNWLR